MTLAAPSVYIGTQAMAGHALADMPVLAGLSFSYGNEDQVDFDDAGTLSAAILIRRPASLDFLKVGAPVGIMDGARTLFAGRIATLKAKPDSRKKDALLVSFTAADTLGEFAQYTPDIIDWYDETNTARQYTGTERRAQIAGSLPPGWTLASTHGATNRDWINTRQQYWESEPLLTAVDNFARSTLSRRFMTTTYVPGTGLAPRLTLTGERAKAAPAEALTTRADGTWYATTSAPANTAFVQLEAKHVGRELEWEKTPSDTITDVRLTSQGVTFGTEDGVMVALPSGEKDTKLAVNTYPDVDNTAIQAAHGIKSIELTVDTFGTSTSPSIGQLVNYWVDADTEWRPTGLEIPDSRKLPDTTVLNLLDVEKRHLAYVTLSGMPDTSPIAGSRVRAYVIAGEATWTGKKWVITLTLGRVPRAPATAGVLTFDSIETHANPAISGATAETVGDTLTFADFAYIGA